MCANLMCAYFQKTIHRPAYTVQASQTCFSHLIYPEGLSTAAYRCPPYFFSGIRWCSIVEKKWDSSRQFPPDGYLGC